LAKYRRYNCVIAEGTIPSPLAVLDVLCEQPDTIYTELNTILASYFTATCTFPDARNF